MSRYLTHFRCPECCNIFGLKSCELTRSCSKIGLRYTDRWKWLLSDPWIENLAANLYLSTRLIVCIITIIVHKGKKKGGSCKKHQLTQGNNLQLQLKHEKNSEQIITWLWSFNLHFPFVFFVIGPSRIQLNKPQKLL